MSERNNDIIEFDFFDDDADTSRRRSVGVGHAEGVWRRPRPEGRSCAARGFTPLPPPHPPGRPRYLVVVVLVFWIQSCWSAAAERLP